MSSLDSFSSGNAALYLCHLRLPGRTTVSGATRELVPTPERAQPENPATVGEDLGQQIGLERGHVRM
jgi:hypothetical protein